MTHHHTNAALAGLRVSELQADAERIRLGRTLRRTRRAQSAKPRTDT